MHQNSIHLFAIFKPPNCSISRGENEGRVTVASTASEYPLADFLNAEYRHVGYLLSSVLKSVRFGGFAPLYRRPQAKNKGISHPFSYSFACPRQGIKNATGLCYPWRCPGRWPVCIQLYGHGAEAPIDGCCTHISTFRGLSAYQGSLNSSKIVVNEVVLTCLKCPWIQCFQGIIRFRLDF